MSRQPHSKLAKPYLRGISRVKSAAPSESGWRWPLELVVTAGVNHVGASRHESQFVVVSAVVAFGLVPNLPRLKVTPEFNVCYRGYQAWGGRSWLR